MWHMISKNGRKKSLFSIKSEWKKIQARAWIQMLYSNPSSPAKKIAEILYSAIFYFKIILVGDEGFEPPVADSETTALPLGESPKYICFWKCGKYNEKVNFVKLKFIWFFLRFFIEYCFLQVEWQ